MTCKKMITIHLGRDIRHDIPLHDLHDENANVHDIITRFIEDGMIHATTDNEKKESLMLLHEMNSRYLFSDEMEIGEGTEIRDVEFECQERDGERMMVSEIHALHPHGIDAREPYIHVDPELLKRCNKESDKHREHPIYLVLLNDEDLEAARLARGTFKSHDAAYDEAVMFDELYGDSHVATLHPDDDVEIERVNAEIAHECKKCGHVDTFYATIEDFDGYEDYCPECGHKFTWHL